MLIELWSLGRDTDKTLEAALQGYAKRINHYNPFQVQLLDTSKIPKTLPRQTLLEKEAELIRSRLQPRDMLIVLDENGKMMSSVQLSAQLNQWMNRAPSRLIFLIGGSYGVASSLQQQAEARLSLSGLTFPHQLVRLLFTEQLYRAFTILRNEKYHHD